MCSKLAALLVSCGTVFAQSAAPAPSATITNQSATSESAIELSPFVISESSETGWIATETLAGSRLRTNFKDIPNQIESLTRDFMADLAVNSIEQAAIYTANAENHNDYVTYTAGAALEATGSGIRVRGIGGGTNSRNFFQVRNPSDNFNLDRATIASGPNAILFGLGSPAGIIDATPARAQMKNRYGFTLQFDSENSKRATFDANSVVWKDKLALRLMGMSKREYTDKKPNLDRDDRIYGALTFRPFKHTSIILQGERDHRGWNRAIRMPPADFVSLWYNADQIPGSGYSGPQPVYDNTNFTNIASNIIFVRAGDVPVLSNDGQPMRSWLNSVTVKNPRQLPGVNQTYDADTNHTVNDPKIFPFDVNSMGTTRANLLGAYTKTAIIEQRLAPDLHLELAYNHEKSYSHRAQSMGGGTGEFITLHVDANRYLPGTTTPNPNLGKLFYQGAAQTVPAIGVREDWRATLSYELDLGRKLTDRGRWMKWLGRHRLSGLYTGGEAWSLSQQSFHRRILDDPVIPGITLRPKTFQNWATHATRIPQFRYYMNGPHDTPTSPGPLQGDWELPDANNNPYALYQYDTPLVSATSGKRLGAGQTAAGSRNQGTAYILAWQGFFLPDREHQSRLVLTYGYRKDTAKSATLDPATTTQDFSGLFPIMWDATFTPYGASQSGINRNVGVVVRPLKWLSLFYNKSTSFDLNVGRYDPFGNEYPGAGGDGKDYGIRFDLWQDKITLRVNRYENALGPQRATNQINDPARDVMFNIETRVLVLDPSTPTINVTDGNRLGYRTAGRPNYWIMSNFNSKGYEVELNVTPVRNWNIRLNGSKSEAVESEIGSPWFEWVKQRLPLWQAVVAKNGEVDSAGRPVTWETAAFNVNNPTGQTLKQYYDNELVAQSLAFISAVDGRATDTARPARANAITNYRITEGRFKGLNFGGAARWRSAPSVGYGTKPGATGIPELDLDQQFRGKQELYFDGILGYRGRLKAFGGLNYRIQLNVRNVLNEDDTIPVTVTTTGQVVRIATVEPRMFVGTFGVDF
jgi:iron complex outermembrane recepter protein